jgi:hypothetical protein
MDHVPFWELTGGVAGFFEGEGEGEGEGEEESENIQLDAMSH